MKGAAIIFFSYVGFDPFNDSARGSQPQRDLPLGIMAALLIRRCCMSQRPLS